VSLAACVAMIEANLLLTTAGKTEGSFAAADVMRLPLGILSGMGFIGGGAILRRGNMVTGVTTAATLWFATVLGLCFGGGQIALGVAGAVLGMVVISGLRPLESRMKQDHQGTLVVTTKGSGPTADELRASLLAQSYKIASCGVVHAAGGERQKVTCEITWRAAARDSSIPEVVRTLAVNPGVLQVVWRPKGA